jgi:class 3 adenylate cyclase
MQTGVLFADLRGFPARFDGADPEEASVVLRRFYRCAEDVLFPIAVIDKLIGDEVMALYLPEMKREFTCEQTPALMLERARPAQLCRLRVPRSAVCRDGDRPRLRRGICGKHRSACAL